MLPSLCHTLTSDLVMVPGTDGQLFDVAEYCSGGRAKKMNIAPPMIAKMIPMVIGLALPGLLVRVEPNLIIGVYFLRFDGYFVRMVISVI